MEMIAADWLKSNKREDDLGSRPGGIVQVSVGHLNPFPLDIQICFDSH